MNTELVQILRQRVPVYVAYDIAEMVYKMEHQEKMAETFDFFQTFDYHWHVAEKKYLFRAELEDGKYGR